MLGINDDLRQYNDMLKHDRAQAEQEIQAAREELFDSENAMKKWSADNSFIVMENHGDMYAIRRQSKSIHTRMLEFYSANPNARLVYRRDNLPSGVNLFAQLRKSKKIDAKRNHFTTKLSQEELCKEIDSLCGGIPDPKKPSQDLCMSE